MPQHVAVLGTFKLPAGAGEGYLQRLVESFRAARTFAAPFNYRLRNAALKSVAPAFNVLPDAEVDLDFHFRHSALPRPGGERELGVLVSRLHSRQLDLRRPLWEAHLIEGLEGGRFAFYFKVHHALMDGVGGSRRMQRMVSPDPADSEVRPLWTIAASRASRPPAAPRSPLGRVAGVAGAAAGALRTVAGLGSAAGGLVREGVRPGDEARAVPYRAPRSRLNVAVSQQRRVATQAVEFARARDIADRADVTINDVFLAICAGGLRRYLAELDALPEAGLIAGTPVSVRVDAGDAANNAFGMTVMKLFTDVADPLERIKAINRSSTLAKQSMEGLSKPVAENYSALFMGPFFAAGMAGLAGHIPPACNVVISNVPGSVETQYLAGAELEAMYPFALLWDGMALFIASLTISGQMSLGFIGDRDALPHLQRLAVYTGEAVTELEQALADTKPRRRRTTAKPKS